MISFEHYRNHDALGLAELVAKGEVTSKELLDTAIACLEEVNPRINAIAQLAVDAAMATIDHGVPAGPFRGVPFLLKDLGAAAIDVPSHLGSRLFANTRYDVDSELVRRLKRAGLVIFGRTTTPELGVGPVTEAKVYGGPTRNPWNPDHTAGGSSGGAAAAVAAGILPAAHGSDGGGSVRIPASSSGLFGLKPTRARMPAGPLASEGWAGMAIDGFLTRSVRDTAALLDATAGPDLGAPYWPPPLHSGYMSAIQRPPARQKIAFSIKSFTGDPVHPDCQAAVDQAVRLLADLGHHVEEADPAPDFMPMMQTWARIVACGTALTLRQKVKARGRDLDPDEIEGVTRGALALAETVSGADYLQAVNQVHRFGRDLARFFQDYDLLVTATLAEPPARIGRFAPDDEDFLDHRLGPSGVLPYSPFTPAFNASGQPAMSVPLHWNAAGLPIGVHIAGRFGADESLIALAAELEAAAPWFDRRPPID
ncbi:MAG: amidase [Alphaproteobacteria bacterium]|nr:amidase [Alphaproteobacteria bacterium]